MLIEFTKQKSVRGNHLQPTPCKPVPQPCSSHLPHTLPHSPTLQTLPPGLPSPLPYNRRFQLAPPPPCPQTHALHTAPKAFTATHPKAPTTLHTPLVSSMAILILRVAPDTEAEGRHALQGSMPCNHQQIFRSCGCVARCGVPCSQLVLSSTFA